MRETTTFRMNPDIHQKAKEYAVHNKIPIGAVYEPALEMYLKIADKKELE